MYEQMIKASAIIITLAHPEFNGDDVDDHHTTCLVDGFYADLDGHASGSSSPSD